MITVLGSVTTREARRAAGGAEVLFWLQEAQGKSIQVVWRGPTSIAVGEVVQASGNLETDGYLLATSIQKVAIPQPALEKPRLYKFRAIIAAVLGNIAGLIGTIIVLALLKVHSNPAWMLMYLMLSIACSGGLARLFAHSNRRANAVWGGALGGSLAVLFMMVLFMVAAALIKAIITGVAKGSISQ